MSTTLNLESKLVLTIVAKAHLSGTAKNIKKVTTISNQSFVVSTKVDKRPFM